MIANKENESTDKKVIQNADDSTDAGLEGPESSNSSTSNIRGAIPKQAFKNYNSPVPGRNAAEYNMNHKNRGMAIIFNHKSFDAGMNQEPRSGTDVDSANLNRVLKKLHFDVIQHDDFCYNQIVNVIERAASENHDNNDCILVVILSHGNMGYICAQDVQYKLADICNLLTPNNCPTLAGKPKLFFVQACQGKQMDDGCKIQTDGDSQMGYKIPLHADFLIAYSTIPGFLSWRNQTYGSWFIQSLCLELETNGKRLDLMTLLTFVCRRVAVDFESHTKKPKKDHKKQIPCITTMLTRIVLFNDKQKTNSKLF